MEYKVICNCARHLVENVALSNALNWLKLCSVLVGREIYDSCFPRYERKNLATIYGKFDYSRVKKGLHRVPLNFLSEKIRLQAYYYPCNDAKGVVVVCHGMHAGADDYIPFIEYFLNNKFAVFTYDCRGTYDSDGDSTVGMCTPLVDLDYAIRYIKKSTILSNMPLLLFGHSWGGYAVTSVLSLHKDIKACAAIASFNDGCTLIFKKGEQYMGALWSVARCRFFKKILNAHQRCLFGYYNDLNAVKGINSLNIPVFIAHGIYDDVINFSSQSLISHQSEIRQENVVYYIGTGIQSGHSTILYSKRAVKYQKRIQKKLKQIKKATGNRLNNQELVAFCKNVDHALYSEVNTELMNEVINLFENSLK